MRVWAERASIGVHYKCASQGVSVSVVFNCTMCTLTAHQLSHLATCVPTNQMQDICKKYNIPTAAYESFTDPDAAKAYIRAQVGW